MADIAFCPRDFPNEKIRPVPVDEEADRNCILEFLNFYFILLKLNELCAFKCVWSLGP